jgi:hypothetical protein
MTIVRYGIYKKGVKILGLFCEPTKDLPHECSNTHRANIAKNVRNRESAVTFFCKLSQPMATFAGPLLL